MNATSTTPPAALFEIGRPLAKVVNVPVAGLTREIRPIAASATYSAPSGPTVLPRARCRPATSRWAVGDARSTRSACAAGGDRAGPQGAGGPSQQAESAGRATA